MINIFCDVIDNFGDAGVCLRLGRDLCNKKEQVNLFCNDLETIKKIIKKDDTKNQYLKISLWPKKENNVELRDTVIQAFSVRLPEYIYSNIKKNTTKNSSVPAYFYSNLISFINLCILAP